eukprot:4238303-Amphidinium_carterae.3
MQFCVLNTLRLKPLRDSTANASGLLVWSWQSIRKVQRYGQHSNQHSDTFSPKGTISTKRTVSTLALEFARIALNFAVVTFVRVG